MDIHTASKYMSHGYRVKRSGWDSKIYLYIGYNGGVLQVDRCIHPNSPDTYEPGDWYPRLHDMVADDWEIVLDGIVDDYGAVKYEDKNEISI
jgi:hypothetical protein